MHAHNATNNLCAAMRSVHPQHARDFRAFAHGRCSFSRCCALFSLRCCLFLPPSLPSRLRVGNSAFAKGDHKGAIAAFTEALTFDPNSVALLSNRSAAYAAIGKDGQQTDQTINDAETDGSAGCMRGDATQRR
jgi:hypothetical protein